MRRLAFNLYASRSRKHHADWSLTDIGLNRVEASKRLKWQEAVADAANLYKRTAPTDWSDDDSPFLDKFPFLNKQRFIGRRAQFDNEPRIAGKDLSAATANGEPAIPVGTVSLPKSEQPEADNFKNYDTDFNTPFNGQWDQDTYYVSDIPQGTGPTSRIGTSIEIVGYEFHFTVQNVLSAVGSGTLAQQQLQATYSWAGTPGTSQTTRTIPPIKFLAGTYISQIRDLAGVAPQFWNAYPIAPPPAPGPNIFLPPAGAGTMTTLMCGSNATAPVPVGGATAVFDQINGPYADCEIQPQQVGVVDAQGFPVLPSWTSPATTLAWDYRSGRIPPCRLILLYDRFGKDDPGPSGLTNIQVSDVLRVPLIGGSTSSALTGLYRMDQLSRYVVLEDIRVEPDSVTDNLCITCPAKECCLPAVWANTNPLIQKNTQGMLRILIVAADLYAPASTEPYFLNGQMRVFFKDA